MKKIIASAALILAILAGSAGTASAGTVTMSLCHTHPAWCKAVIKSEPNFRDTADQHVQSNRSELDGHQIRTSR